MKAVTFSQSFSIDHPEALVDTELPEPELRPQDLLVAVEAVGLNPVDYKVRRSALPEPGAPRVLGWDAAGTVLAVGPAVRRFRVGDRVWYAGALDRPGSYAQRQAVDERLVGAAPRTLDWAQAAALPLTAITAWELLFERLQVPRQQGGEPADDSLLITGAAGGVGSILVQLARQLTGLRVIATAGRPESAAWLRELGAHAVLDHTQLLRPQLQALGLEGVRRVASLTHTEQHWEALIDLLLPQGQLALIDDPVTLLDLRQLKRKSLSLHWELMFTRSLYQTPDQQRQGELLAEVAALVDAGRLRSTLNECLGPINAASLRRGHALLESGQARGKLVAAGW